MEPNQVINDFLSTVIKSVTPKVVVDSNQVLLDREHNVLIDSMHIIKDVVSIRGEYIDGIRSVTFFDNDGVELHSIESSVQGFMVLITDLIYYEETGTPLLAMDIKKYELSSINESFIETYPRLSYEINTVETQNGLAAELTIKIKPDMFNNDITIVKQPFPSMKDIYVKLPEYISDISVNIETIIGLLSGHQQYIVLNGNVYLFQGLENNGIRVLVIDLYADGDNNTVSFIPYKVLANVDFYTMDENTYHIVDSRIFKCTEDYGNIKALKGVIEEGEGYKDCLLYRLNKTIFQIQEIEQSEMEQEQKDSLLKSMLNIALVIIGEIEDSSTLDRLGDDVLLWYYKGSLMSLSREELSHNKQAIETKFSQIESEVLVEEEHECL